MGVGCSEGQVLRMESSLRVRCSWAGSPCCEVAPSPCFPRPVFCGVSTLGLRSSQGLREEPASAVPLPTSATGLQRALCHLRPQELNANVVTSHFWPRISSPYSKHLF